MGRSIRWFDSNDGAIPSSPPHSVSPHAGRACPTCALLMPKSGKPDFGGEREKKNYAVVLSNTPPLDFSLRASSVYSESTSLRSLSPVFASGTETILRPLR